jgi:hypothetical protein
MGKTFVYNSGSYKEENNGVLSMEFGLFFDGTANNLYNTDARKYMTYKKIEKGKLSKRAKEELERIERDYPQQKEEFIKYILPQQAPTLSPTIESTETPHKYTLDQLSKGYKTYGAGNVSYGNDHTNVARMYLNANRKDYAIYIEGVGTKDLEGDYSLRGISYAVGVTGLLEKVKKGSEELAQRIKMLYDRKIENSKIEIGKIVLTLDVFGFSRGAAAARHFLFQVSHNKCIKEVKKRERIFLDVYKERKSFEATGESYLQSALKKVGLNTLVSSINLRFVGIFDTVASFNPKKGDLGTDFEKYIHLLHLNDIGKPRLVVHFTALDEIRRYFSLTRLAPFLGIEKNLPGAHSDVGGSYHSDGTPALENVLLEYESIGNLKEELMNEGWYKEDELVIEDTRDPYNRRVGNIKLWGRREVRGEYSYLPLQWMLKYASFQIKKGQLKIDKMNDLYKIDSGTILCEVQKHLDSTTFKELANMTYGIKGYGELNRFIARDRIVQEDWTFESGIAQELLKKLRHKYLHQSAHYEGAVEPHAPNNDRKRREFPG